MRARTLAVASSLLLAEALVMLTAGCGREPLSAQSVDGDIGVIDTATAAVVVAIIDQSASTNARSSEVVVYSDGSAVRTVEPPAGGFLLLPDGGSVPLGPAPASFPPGSPEVMRFLADLAVVGDVSAIATSWCPKSVSFGTTTTVWARGEQSGDLQCADSPSPAQAAFISDCLNLSS
jgi:hypothetical protein